MFPMLQTAPPADRMPAPLDAARSEQRRHLRRDLPAVSRCCPRVSYAIGRRRHVAGVAADARHARGGRRQPAGRVSRGAPARARAPGAANPCAPTPGRDRFLRSLRACRQPRREALFDYRPEHAQLFVICWRRGRGIILVSGHYGNWELGGVVMRRVFKLPLTIVAMAEASDDGEPVAARHSRPASAPTRSRSASRSTPRFRFAAGSPTTGSSRC